MVYGAQRPAVFPELTAQGHVTFGNTWSRIGNGRVGSGVHHGCVQAGVIGRRGICAAIGAGCVRNRGIRNFGGV